MFQIKFILVDLLSIISRYKIHILFVNRKYVLGLKIKCLDSAVPSDLNKIFCFTMKFTLNARFIFAFIKYLIFFNKIFNSIDYMTTLYSIVGISYYFATPKHTFMITQFQWQNPNIIHFLLHIKVFMKHIMLLLMVEFI